MSSVQPILLMACSHQAGNNANFVGQLGLLLQARQPTVAQRDSAHEKATAAYWCTARPMPVADC